MSVRSILKKAVTGFGVLAVIASIVIGTRNIRLKNAAREITQNLVPLDSLSLQQIDLFSELSGKLLKSVTMKQIESLKQGKNVYRTESSENGIATAKFRPTKFIPEFRRASVPQILFTGTCVEITVLTAQIAPTNSMPRLTPRVLFEQLDGIVGKVAPQYRSHCLVDYNPTNDDNSPLTRNFPTPQFVLPLDKNLSELPTIPEYSTPYQPPMSHRL